MSETEVPEMVAISREELEILRAGQPATVTITAEEFRDLKAKASAGGGIDPASHERLKARLGEVERQLRIEMADHAEEAATWRKSQ